MYVYTHIIIYATNTQEKAKTFLAGLCICMYWHFDTYIHMYVYVCI